MEYYPFFRKAILHWMAGWIRVTHPCAGRRQGQQAILPFPLDLHVLSLQLAFILSQDQTLHCKISFRISLTECLFFSLSLRMLILKFFRIGLKTCQKKLTTCFFYPSLQVSPQKRFLYYFSVLCNLFKELFLSRFRFNKSVCKGTPFIP